MEMDTMLTLWFFFGIFSYCTCQGEDDSCGACPSHCHQCNKDFLMYAAAGFMTASLMFSLGCFMSRYKASNKKSNKPDQTAPTNEHETCQRYVVNGGTNEDQVSLDYCNIRNVLREDNDLPPSSRSTRPEIGSSYDTVDHNGVMFTTMAENVNPYNHAADTDDTEYDKACHFPPRTEVFDPTYSHTSEVNDEKCRAEKTIEKPEATYTQVQKIKKAPPSSPENKPLYGTTKSDKRLKTLPARQYKEDDNAKFEVSSEETEPIRRFNERRHQTDKYVDEPSDQTDSSSDVTIGTSPDDMTSSCYTSDQSDTPSTNEDTSFASESETEPLVEAPIVVMNQMYEDVSVNISEHKMEMI